MDDQFIRMMNSICASIKESGLDPYEQLTGYIRTGNERYITRRGNAREMIKSAERKKLKEYVTYLKSIK